MEPNANFTWPASLIINQEADTVEFRFPNIPDSRIEQIQLLDTAGVLFATIEVRHNPSSPRLVSFNTAMRINSTATYDLSSFSLAKTENSTITLSFNSSVILGKPAAALTGFTYNVTSTSLPKLPAPADMQWDSSNPGYASWTSPYQCVQFHSVDGQSTGYNTNLKKDGNNRYYRGMTDIIQKKSGTYQMMAMALGDWENGDSDVVSTEPLVYTIPETKLPVVTGLHFEGTTIFFNAIEGVTEYHIELYGIDKSTGQWVQAKHARMVQTNFSDIQSWLKQESGKYDKFGVRVNAVSPDLMNIAAGDVSELCIYGE
ncbi:MAG: hypothetical protein J6B06_08035 [Lachnospiraceae bacterium]|nr:hypothetical protein [Lachnospiraceae bacterium]